MKILINELNKSSVWTNYIEYQHSEWFNDDCYRNIDFATFVETDLKKNDIIILNSSLDFQSEEQYIGFILKWS